MFAIHQAADDIQMACSLKCLTLLAEPKSTENGDCVARSNVPDPPIEHLPILAPMVKAIEFIVCVEILHSILVSRNVSIDCAGDHLSSEANVTHVTSRTSGAGHADAQLPEMAVNRGWKRMYEEVDQDSDHLDDDLIKRVKESENGEESTGTVLNVIINDGVSAVASAKDEDLLELSPSDLLQLFIDSEVVSISWNTDNVATEELKDIDNQLNASTDDDRSSEISLTGNRTLIIFSNSSVLKLI